MQPAKHHEMNLPGTVVKRAFLSWTQHASEATVADLGGPITAQRPLHARSAHTPLNFVFFGHTRS